MAERDEDGASGNTFFAPERSGRQARKTELARVASLRKERTELESRIESILKNDECGNTPSQQDSLLLQNHPDVVSKVEEKLLQRKKRKEMRISRSMELKDSEEEIRQKVLALCKLIKEACESRSSKKSNGCNKNVYKIVLHCGAGISTSAGIPDFRSPQGLYSQSKNKKRKTQCSSYLMHPYEQYQPSVTHMIITAMVNAGIVDHVISQNIDGLHLRSGLDPSYLTELHGNVFKERCVECDKEYLRHYNVTRSKGTSFRRHFTGRLCDNQLDVDGNHQVNEPQSGLEKEIKFHVEGVTVKRTTNERKRKNFIKDDDERCEADVKDELPFNHTQNECIKAIEKKEKKRAIVRNKDGEEMKLTCLMDDESKLSCCGGKLQDTIIHFGECINKQDLAKAKTISKNSVLAICLGTSLKVPPACNLPRMAQKTVVVNLQWTQLDKIVSLKINAPLDIVMSQLAESLNIDVPPYDAKLDPILAGIR